MCFWNIGGLTSKGVDKTCDPVFIKSLEPYDLAFLVETHLGYNSIVGKIGTFHYHPICRSVTKSNNRYFGGIAILRKPHVKEHIKILKNTNPDYQWVRLDKKHFGFRKNLYICVVYFPPTVSSYTKSLEENIFDCLEKDIANFSRDSDILICGDFNARIGTCPDYILQDDSKFVPLFDSYPIDQNRMERKNSDIKLDTRGKELLNFCISHQLRVLNGRTFGDLYGNYTCFTPNGASVVDYSIVSESALDNILYFKVSEFKPTLSDCHCKIEWEMSANYCSTTPKGENCNVFEMPCRYMWSEDSATLFQDALSSRSLQAEIGNLVGRNDLHTALAINTAATELKTIFLHAADISLKKIRK